MKKEWNYYVGDPCYVIDDNQWSEFCNLLWKAESSGSGDVEWPVEPENHGPNGEVYGDGTETVEVWDSPFGDGCWGFANTVNYMRGWVAGNEMGVDAGLLAIVPRECVHKDNMERIEHLGILFDEYPSLETGENLGGHVHLNGNHPDDYYTCDCGEITTDDQMWWCDNCGDSACGYCGGNCDCRECECGNYYEYDGWRDSGKCDDCEEEE